MTHGPDPRSLTPGVLDGAAENAFARGACSALAIAMHDALGWPVVAITDAHNVHGGRAGGGSALHWTVRRPDGLLVDVLGAHEPDRLVADYADEADDAEAAWGLSSRADALEWYAEGAGSAIPLGLARTFVDAVVERAATRPANRVGPEDGDPRP
jgi:hypothetical protein